MFLGGIEVEYRVKMSYLLCWPVSLVIAFQNWKASLLPFSTPLTPPSPQKQQFAGFFNNNETIQKTFCSTQNTTKNTIQLKKGGKLFVLG